MATLAAALDAPRKLARQVIDAPARSWFTLVLERFCSRHQGAAMAVVFDLDNTLGDAASSWFAPHVNTTERLRAIAPIPPMLRLLAESQARWPTLVMTARRFRDYPVSAAWLQRHCRVDPLKELVVCRTSADKAPLLARMQRDFPRVVLIDDMSWGHEERHVRVRHDEIAALQAQGIVWFGLPFIASVVEGGDGAMRGALGLLEGDPLR